MWSLFEGTAWAQAAAGRGAQAVRRTAIADPDWGRSWAGRRDVLFPHHPAAEPEGAEHAKMLSGLKRNDEVVTTGGIIGGFRRWATR